MGSVKFPCPHDLRKFETNTCIYSFHEEFSVSVKFSIVCEWRVHTYIFFGPVLNTFLGGKLPRESFATFF